MTLDEVLTKHKYKAPTLAQMKAIKGKLNEEDYHEFRQMTELGLCPWDKKPGWDKVL